MDNYLDSFIRVAADCPATVGRAPSAGRSNKTIPQLEYELLANAPHKLTQPELLFAVHVLRLGISQQELKSQRKQLWEEFFKKSRACLRASMLPKKFGWGLHFNSAGKIRLVAVESDEYQELANGVRTKTVLTAMRNRRG